jgi:hypothetical protein
VENNEIYCFEFLNSNHEKIYALWTRVKNSKTDSGATLNYTFDMGYQPKYAYTNKPKDKDLDGEKTELNLTGSTVNLSLTETPLFLVVSDTKTAINTSPGNEINFKVYPNPANSSAEISFLNPAFQKINLSVFSADGKLVEVLADKYLNTGRQQFSFGGNVDPGIYFICLQTPGFKKLEKLMIL